MQSKGLSRAFSNTAVQKHQFFSTQLSFFIVQLSHPYPTTGKTLALTRWTFVHKVTSLLFNMAFRFPSRLLSKCSFLFLRYRLCFLFFCYTGSLLLHGLSLVAMSRGYSLRVVRRLLIAGASPLAEHGLWGERSQQLRLLGSRAWAQRLRGQALVILRHMGSSCTRD